MTRVPRTRGPWWPLLALIRKELIQALRDRQMLFMIVAAPMIQIVLFGYAAQLEFKHADTVVVDEDRTADSRAFIEGLGADDTFRVRWADDVPAAVDVLRHGDATVVLIVPHGFASDRAAGGDAAVQVLYDGSDPTLGVSAASAIEAYAASQTRIPVGLAPIPVGQIILEPRLLYNPGLDSRRFFVPGTAASLLVVVTMLVTAMGLAREREVGTLEQLLVTPMGPMTLMLGKMVPYALFGLLDEILILVIGNLVFDVPIQGDLAVLALGTAGYLGCTLALGLLIAASARTQQQAFMGGFFFMMPAILLSGFMTPIEAMPSWLQPITIVNPMRHFVEISRSILLRDASFTDVAPHVAWLYGIAVTLLVTAALRFRRTVA
ncbi:MAG: ABC transporter permease [Kofleriaceae bacterium]|nr:ABC transporter permease [Myxococcales bacterium]MCB9561220.1 ABC transporter permease [Kofleriaceae bacterium]MCB9573799.1 ABC transporter permease [Kofleriaceae bacterium]